LNAFKTRILYSIAHIINPVLAPADSELARVQPVTYASMRRAREYAQAGVEVRFWAAVFADEQAAVPEGFSTLPFLERSLADLPEISSKRKLPFLRDVLERAVAATEADYIVYSNSDIVLMPNFYAACASYFDQGIDAFAVNRRRISGKYASPDALEAMYAEVGELHSGYDTFVFRRSLFAKFTLGEVCIGLPFFDSTLLFNLIAHGSTFRLFTRKHLTFHLGMELVKNWGDQTQIVHNQKAYLAMLKILQPQLDIATIPGASLPLLKRHFKWLMNPTFHYPTLLVLDWQQRNRKRKSRPEQEVAGMAYAYQNWLTKVISFPEES
jgi:hypothetical protein